jgi:hypothetical protein
MRAVMPETGAIDVQNALAVFPGAAVTRTGLWDFAAPQPGKPVKAADEEASGEVRSALQGMLSEWVAAMCSGELGCDTKAIAFATQALSRLDAAAATKSGVLSVQVLELGQGKLPAPAAMLGAANATDVATALLHQVCAVGPPAHSAKRQRSASHE